MARKTPRTLFAWESEYYRTVLEKDDVRLAVRVKTLEGKLLLRLLDLSGDPEEEEELMAVEKALRALAILKKGSRDCLAQSAGGGVNRQVG